MENDKPTVKVCGKPNFAPSLIKALGSIRSKMPEAKLKLSKLPLKDVTNPIDGTISMVRIASAEDLQRIIMQVFMGEVIVNTIPVSLNGTASVTAYVSILTDDGYVRMPGSSASESQGASITDKVLLAAESRAIRRAIRELGLRAEYEVYDENDTTMQVKASKVKKDEDEDEDSSLEVVEELDDDIPDPDDAKGKNSVSRGIAKVVAKKSTTKKSTAKKAKIKPISVEHKKVDVKPNYENDEWPNKKAITYCDTLVKKLTVERKKVGLTVESFIKSVLGDEVGSNTFRSCSTLELECLYQFYIIGSGHNNTESK